MNELLSIRPLDVIRPLIFCLFYFQKWKAYCNGHEPADAVAVMQADEAVKRPDGQAGLWPIDAVASVNKSVGGTRHNFAAESAEVKALQRRP